MELTINNLIKMTIAVLVIVLFMAGLYLGMKTYVIPYFSGIGFEEPRVDVGSQFGQTLIKPENQVGTVGREDGFFYNNGQKTSIYFKKGKIKVAEGKWISSDSEIGSVTNDGKIIIDMKYVDPLLGGKYTIAGINLDAKLLNGAYKFGLEIYKIGGKSAS